MQDITSFLTHHLLLVVDLHSFALSFRVTDVFAWAVSFPLVTECIRHTAPIDVVD